MNIPAIKAREVFEHFMEEHTFAPGDLVQAKHRDLLPLRISQADDVFIFFLEYLPEPFYLGSFADSIQDYIGKFSWMTVDCHILLVADDDAIITGTDSRVLRPAEVTNALTN